MKLRYLLPMFVLWAGTSFALVTEHANTVNLVLADVCDGTFNDFKFQISGYDDQVFDFNYDVDLTGVAASFRITKPIEGTIYLDVPITSVTVAGTNIHFHIARTNIPPPGSYYGEVLTYESTATNVTRSVAQGKLPITWSLYLNETNYFNRSTTNASVGQVYVHPNWIDPPWLSTSAAIGNIYFTIVNGTILSNWAASRFTAQGNTNSGFESRIAAEEALSVLQAATNADLDSRITSAAGETNWAAVSNTITTYAENGQTAYGWGDHASYNYLSATQNIYAAMTVGDRSKLNTNIAGLAQGSYTGIVGGTIAYTGATVLTVGSIYVWGYSHVGYGTSTLTIAGQTLGPNTAVANYSNHFTYAAGSNLVITLSGTAAGLGYATNIYVKEVTTGQFAAVDGYFKTLTMDGSPVTNATVAIGLLNDATNDLNTRAGNLESATNALNTRVGNLEGSTNALNTRVGTLEGLTNSMLVWIDTSKTNTLTISGFGMNPDVSGTYTQIADFANLPAYARTDGVYYVAANAEIGPYYISTNSGASGEYILSDTQPLGQYSPEGSNTGTPVVANSGLIRAGYNSTAGAWQIEQGGVVVQSWYVGSNVLGTRLYGDGGGLTNVTAATDPDVLAATNALNTRAGTLESATNALDGRETNLEGATNVLNTRVGALEVPYQTWTILTTTNDAGSTGWCNIAYSSGPLVYLAATTDPTVVTFDSSSYANYTNGVLRVGLEIWPDTNNVGFDTTMITNESVTITTGRMNSVFFRRTSTNTVWVGRD